ncbi:MAG: DUF2868 domain-containing protein [Burkholderiaceae bacterium]|nr:DUF2868 domain-containing protein [Burkholderiaceae bacterium]
MSRLPGNAIASAAAPARAIPETTAQRLLLVRAAEQAGELGPLNRTDLEWADRAGAGPPAGPASGPPAAVRRAERLFERLVDRDPHLPRWLAGLRWPAWVGPIVIAGAGLAGMASDAIGPAARINLLAAPLLGVLAWNLAVMASTGAASARQAWRTAWRHYRPAAPASSASSHGGPQAGGPQAGGPQAGGPQSGRGSWLAHAVDRAARWQSGIRSEASPATGAGDWRSRFAADWLRASAPLTRARAGALLHSAAAVLAGSMLAGLYLRGLAFEFRAGWESTFLDAPAVHTLLSLVLGPASALSGIPLPDAGQLALLRFDRGPGENAGPWIHLLAITIALFAVAPRALMALAAAQTVRRLRADFPLPDPALGQDPAAAPGDGVGQRVLAVPCGWRISASASRALADELRRTAGSAAEIAIAASIAPEQADEPQGLPVLSEASRVIVVFNLSATPERETHGRCLLALQHRMVRGTPLEAWIDGAAFASRFAGQPQRLAERQAAWQDLLREYSLPARFVHLEPTA